MLYFEAEHRLKRRDRRDRITDISAGQHGGDFAKKLMQTLGD